MKVAIPEERVEGEVSDRLRNMAQSVRIPGFRPGKVPLKVVAQRYGRQVRDEVVGEVVRSSFYDAVVQENLRPAGTRVSMRSRPSRARRGLQGDLRGLPGGPDADGEHAQDQEAVRGGATVTSTK